MPDKKFFIPYALDEFFSDPPWREIKAELSKSLKETNTDANYELASSIRQIPAKFPYSASLDAFFCLVGDLIDQAWILSLSTNGIFFDRPLKIPKEQLQRQLLVRRNDALAKKEIQNFLSDFNKTKQGKKNVSILFHDGLEFLKEIKAVNNGKQTLEDTIKPELIFFDAKEREPETGQRFVDIWRFCRLTWSLEHQSIPGRELPFIIRNAAAKNKPIMGIGCLASPVLQNKVRDKTIGWTFESTQHSIIKGDLQIKSLIKILNDIQKYSLNELFIEDFNISEEELKNPSNEQLHKLDNIAYQATQKRIESLESDEKIEAKKYQQRDLSEERLLSETKSSLYTKKRAEKLRKLLQCRMFLNLFEGSKRSEFELRDHLFNSKDSNFVISFLLGEIRTLGVSSRIAELNVCGAIPPYNHIIGGKLVALTALSAEIQKEYSKRYGKMESDIASRMAGRKIFKSSSLELVTTTSLYGRKTSQYNRVKLRKKEFPELPFDLEWEDIGKTQGQGTFHFSNATSAKLNTFYESHIGYKNVNNKFGEGTGAKLRKLRSAIQLLGINSNSLLTHGQERGFLSAKYNPNAYENLWNFKQRKITSKVGFKIISDAWLKRWATKRVKKQEVLESIKAETYEKLLSNLLIEDHTEIVFSENTPNNKIQV